VASACGVVVGAAAGAHAVAVEAGSEAGTVPTDADVPEVEAEGATVEAEGAAAADEQQATLNIGIIGHVSHGKSSLVRALSGVKTQKHKEELERNITIRLGYANAKIYECVDAECPPADRFVARPSSHPAALVEGGRRYRLVRHVSFVDCPGHEALMSCMLSGAAVMDAALLLVAADEPCPAAQTAEHLGAAECLGLRHIVTVQNKVDLVGPAEAEAHYEQVRAFIKGSAAEAHGVTPVCANLGHGLSALCAQIASLPQRANQPEDARSRMHLVRSFDVNRPGTAADALAGGVLGGALCHGELRVGQ